MKLFEKDYRRESRRRDPDAALDFFRRQGTVFEEILKDGIEECDSMPFIRVSSRDERDPERGFPIAIGSDRSVRRILRLHRRWERISTFHLDSCDEDSITGFLERNFGKTAAVIRRRPS